MTFGGDRSADVPLFSRCVVGFRAWVADDESALWPIGGSRRAWAPGMNTARCNRVGIASRRLQWAIRDGRAVVAAAPLHDAPIADCRCGLYSWRRPPGRWFKQCAPLPTVVGAVACWGSLQVHDDGFRAQHACVVAIARRDDAKPAELTALAAIARRYRVELVSLDELAFVASRFGSPLPEGLRPPREAAPRLTVPTMSPPQPAPDATSELLITPAPVGFDGRPLPRTGLEFPGSGIC